MSTLALDDALADDNTDEEEVLAPPLAAAGGFGGHKTISFFGARAAVFPATLLTASSVVRAA